MLLTADPFLKVPTPTSLKVKCRALSKMTDIFSLKNTKVLLKCCFCWKEPVSSLPSPNRWTEVLQYDPEVNYNLNFMESDLMIKSSLRVFHRFSH